MQLHSWGYSMKIPFPQKTGHKLKDDDAESKVQLLASTIETLMEDPGHLLPTHSLLEKRKQAAKSQAQADADALFNTLSTVRSLPEDWIIGFLASVSDLKVADIMPCKKQDGDAAWCMLVYETQIPLQVHLWPELQVKEVMLRFLRAMSTQYGNRLKDFKKGGGVVGANVFWKKGCYLCEFAPQTGKLTSINHRATNTTVTIEETYIDKTWKLDSNWSDYGACFRKGHSPPYKVTSFFAKGTGPLATPAVSARQKDTHQMVLLLHKQWQGEVANTKTAGVTSVEAAQGLRDLQKEARKNASDKMRERGLEQVPAKRARRMSSFED